MYAGKTGDSGQENPIFLPKNGVLGRKTQFFWAGNPCFCAGKLGFWFRNPYFYAGKLVLWVGNPYFLQENRDPEWGMTQALQTHFSCNNTALAAQKAIFTAEK